MCLGLCSASVVQSPFTDAWGNLNLHGLMLLQMSSQTNGLAGLALRIPHIEIHRMGSMGSPGELLWHVADAPLSGGPQAGGNDAD